MGDTWDIQGLEELGRAIANLTKSLNPDKVEPILNKGAKYMTGTIKGNAPKGPTGNLKRSVKTKKLKALAWNTPAASIAAIDHKIAPHAWLVENRGKSKGFFRRSVDEAGGTVIDIVESGLGKLIDEGMK